MRKDLLWIVAIVVIGLMMAWCAPVAAQTGPIAVNPDTVEFDPSADHNGVILGTTTPAVTRYELRLYALGAGTPFTRQDLGKPAPGNDGKIRITNRSWFVLAAMGTICVGRVAAIGPAGEAESEPSNQWGNSGAPGRPGVPIIRCGIIGGEPGGNTASIR